MQLLPLTLSLLAWVPSVGVPAPSGGRIEGRVLDPHGNPAIGARVILGEIGHATLHYNAPKQMFVTTPGLSDADAARYAAEVRTDGAGRFAAGGLASGEFSILVADEHALALASIRSDGDATEVEIALQPAAFVEGKSERRAFDRSVHVLELKPRAATGNVLLAPALAREGESWTFRSSPLPPIVAWQIVGTEVVLAQDYRATLFNLPADARPGETARVPLRVDGGLHVAGRLLGPSGEPLRYVSVVARLSGGLLHERGAITDADGEYGISGLAPGRWDIEARRWTMRDLAGCGNGRLDLQKTVEVNLPLAADGRVDFAFSAFHTVPVVGEPAPDFEVVTIGGAPLRLSGLRGKVVLIDFWATWCGMCRVEMPRLSAAHAELARDGRFEIVGVSLDDDPDLVRRFTASRGLHWPHTALGLADKNPIARLYNVSSTPATVLIDRAGAIAALNLTGEPLRKKIEELLAVR